MTDTQLLITNSAILAGILLLGLLAKLFPRRNGKVGSRHGARKESL
jgi:hypothetical protein